MPVPPFRVKQTTQTTGTGAVQLDPASVLHRSFQQHYGTAARRVRFGVASTSGFEVALGTFDGGSPGTLTRDTVLASSAGGALLALPAGTKDVFAVPDLDREVISAIGPLTLVPADLNAAVVFSGASAASLVLPAAASCPVGSGFLVANAGTAALSVTAPPSTVKALAAGESCEVLRTGAGWTAFSGSAQAAAGGGGGGAVNSAVTKKTSALAASVEFALPSGVQCLRFMGVGIATQNNADVGLQASRDNAATWQTSGGYYRQSSLLGFGISPVTAGDYSTLGFVGVVGPMQPNLAAGMFDITVHPGSTTSTLTVQGMGSYRASNDGSTDFTSYTASATTVGQHTHVRFVGNGSNLAGTFYMEVVG